ncbi:hypothetical protein ABZ897_43275 [Nonomuraea sp. NPDC046802]|uniref:hypothetical protein n=1 Tax=Nonomuraea sp. NPDC046802 TaxID=3154919 RepID=UPI003408F478
MARAAPLCATHLHFLPVSKASPTTMHRRTAVFDGDPIIRRTPEVSLTTLKAIG